MDKYILVLGAGKRNTRPNTDSRIRVRAAYYLYQKLKQPIIFSEGKDTPYEISGARAMYEYAKNLGYNLIPIFEEESTNTLENIENTQKLIGSFNEIYLVTQKFHIKRASNIAKDYFEKIHPSIAEEIIKNHINKNKSKHPYLRHLLNYLKKKNKDPFRREGKTDPYRLKYFLYNLLTS